MHVVGCSMARPMPSSIRMLGTKLDRLRVFYWPAVRVRLFSPRRNESELRFLSATIYREVRRETHHVGPRRCSIWFCQIGAVFVPPSGGGRHGASKSGFGK